MLIDLIVMETGNTMSVEQKILSQPFHYGAFWIENLKAIWKQNPHIQIKLNDSLSKSCEMEGIWDSCVSRKMRSFSIA